MERSNYFYTPQHNLMGIGCLSNLDNELLSRGYKRALIVTDKNLVRVGHVGKVEEILKANNIDYTIFDGVEYPNPNVKFVENGLKHFKENKGILNKNYDFVISIGGGTNHDAAKAISALITNGGSIVDYEGNNKLPKPMLPLVAINTTAGSGAQVTHLVVITDDKRKTKMSIVDPKFMPTISVNDPLLHLSAPKEVTISAGIDVLCHGVEAYVANNAFPYSDALALQSMKLFINNIRKVATNGNDLEARNNMAYAASMASTAFINSGLGYLHAIVHQIGGYSNRHHGLLCGAILPFVLEFNAPAIPVQRMVDMANALGIEDVTRVNAIDKLIYTIQELNSDLGLPKDMYEMLEMIADENTIKSMADMAVKNLSSLTNPRQGTIDNIAELIQKIIYAQSGQKEKEQVPLGV